jgi:hypothetical protein
LIHHELFSRIKEGATDQEQNAEPPEMLSTAAILSHMKHKPLGLRLLSPCQTRDAQMNWAGPTALPRYSHQRLTKEWTVKQNMKLKAGS